MKKQPWTTYVLLAALVARACSISSISSPARPSSRPSARSASPSRTSWPSSGRRSGSSTGSRPSSPSSDASLAELEHDHPPQEASRARSSATSSRWPYDSGIETVLRIAPDRGNRTGNSIPSGRSRSRSSGNYHTLGAFFDRILHFPRIFNIDDFSITALPSQTAETTISARFTARTYFFLEESPIKKPEPKPKPVSRRNQSHRRIAESHRPDALSPPAVRWRIERAGRDMAGPGAPRPGRRQPARSKTPRRPPTAGPALQERRAFSYSSGGRRDPFKDLFGGQDIRERRVITGFADLLMDEIRIMGIVADQGPSAWRSSCLPEGFPVTVRDGDRFADGYVLSIEEAQVVLRKTRDRGVPLIKPRDIVKEITP